MTATITPIAPKAISPRTPDLIAAEICSIKGQTQTIILHASVEIGRRLVEAKALVKHGEWGQWLEASVDYSQSTANNLMKIFREYGDGKFPTVANLPYTKALALLGVPAEEREAFVADNEVEAMSKRELAEKIQENAELRKQKEEAEEAARRARDEVVKQLQLQEDALRQKEAIEIELATLRKNDTKKEDTAALLAKLEAVNEQLQVAEGKVQTLTAEAAKPATVVEVPTIPAELEHELTELRAMAQRATSNAAVATYRVQFDAVATGFQSLLKALAEIKTTSPDEYAKYHAATGKLLERMTSQL